MTENNTTPTEPVSQTISPDGHWAWDGTAWIPNDAGLQPAGPTTNPSGNRGRRIATRVGIGVGGAFLALIALGAVVGDQDAPASTDGAAVTASEQSAEKETAEDAAEAEAAAADAAAASASADAAAAEAEEAAAEEAAAEKAAAETPYGIYPSDQKKFVETIEAARDEIDSSNNDLKQSAALRQRDKDLAAILGGGLSADDWVGTVTAIGANGEGKAYVEIEIAENVRVMTWNNAFSDIGDNTLIPESSTMFNNLLAMNTGDQVVFSGRFFKGSDTALRGTNITDTFYGFDPKFLVKFSAIKAG